MSCQVCHSWACTCPPPLPKELADIQFDEVTMGEYLHFLKIYPRPLKANCANFCEPPLVSLYDWTKRTYKLGTHEAALQCEVARYTPAYRGEPTRYYLRRGAI